MIEDGSCQRWLSEVILSFEKLVLNDVKTSDLRFAEYVKLKFS